MHDDKPSRTAFRVGVRRAAHQLFDSPKVLHDPLALSIIGSEAASKLSTDESVGSQSLRAFMAVRSRYAEDELASAFARGVRQYVVLGAGLDTFAYRNPHAGLRVFEVDHPATQEWKRELLRAAGIAIPDHVTFVPIDFERQLLADILRESGLHAGRPAFFSWLGVVPYLTDSAFTATLGYIAAMPPETAVVFDYAVARSALSFRDRMILNALMTRVAAAGEPFQLFFEPAELAERVRQMGFQSYEDLGAVEMNSRYFGDRSDGLCIGSGLGRLLSARV